MINHRLIEVATSARARTEALAVAAGFKTTPASLRGCCEFASFGLAWAARESSVRGVYVVEGLYDGTAGQEHFWCQVGDIVIDITATQFSARLSKIHIANVGEAPYASVRRRCRKPSRVMDVVIRRCRIQPGWWRDGAVLVGPERALLEAS